MTGITKSAPFLSCHLLCTYQGTVPTQSTRAVQMVGILTAFSKLLGLVYAYQLSNATFASVFFISRMNSITSQEVRSFSGVSAIPFATQ